MAFGVQSDRRMKIQIEMPIIEQCDANECAYNHGQQCHARAITIGGGHHPACDTYISRLKEPARAHHSETSHNAGVGACKVHACRHNRNLECEAPAIHVKQHSSHADCVTYESS